MLQHLSKYAHILILWTIIAAGMGLRIHNGDYFPIYQNDDSPFYIWLGNSLWENFTKPSSLTIFETDNPTLFWRSQYMPLIPADSFGFRLAEEFFDHPFLASVVVSLPSRYFGFTGFMQIPQMLVRTPAFFAALLSLVMTYILTREVFGVKTGLLAVGLLAFWPLAIFAQRQGYLENMITPVYLLSLWLVWQIKSKPTKVKFILLILCGVWAGWTKLAGYILFVVAAYFLKIWGQTRWALYMIFASVFSLGAYLFYGQLIGGQHFWWTIFNQGGRGAYLTSISIYFSSAQIQGHIQDGWWYLGLIGMMYAATRKGINYQLIGFSALAWWLSAFFLAGPENTSPWYLYPVYPLLMIGLAVLVKDGVRRFPTNIELIWLFLGLTGWRLAGVEIPSHLLRLIIGLWVVITGLWLVWPVKLRADIGHRILLAGMIGLAIIGNVLAVRKVPSQVCGNGGCTQPTKIILPKL